jgi:hypothetical protein
LYVVPAVDCLEPSVQSFGLTVKFFPLVLSKAADYISFQDIVPSIEISGNKRTEYGLFVSGSDGYVRICRCDRTADHHRVAKWVLCEKHLFMLINKMSEQGCYVENVIVWAVMADILAVMVYGWYRMMKDDE